MNQSFFFIWAGGSLFIWFRTLWTGFMLNTLVPALCALGRLGYSFLLVTFLTFLALCFSRLIVLPLVLDYSKKSGVRTWSKGDVWLTTHGNYFMASYISLVSRMDSSFSCCSPTLFLWAFAYYIMDDSSSLCIVWTILKKYRLSICRPLITFGGI